MKKELSTLGWFLKNPRYIPQVFQILKRRSNEALEDSREESTAWCQEHCISQEEALKQLCGIDKMIPLKELFPQELEKAEEKEKNCPVKMGGQGAISFLYHLVHAGKAKNIIETGVAYGWSSLAILLAIKEREGARLISNDMPYIKMDNADYVGCIVDDSLRPKWDLQRLADVNGIPKAIARFNNQVEIFHYDSDKSYTGRMWSSPIIWKALVDGAYFISDDINDNLAFTHFCEQVNRKPLVIEHDGKFVGIIQK